MEYGADGNGTAEFVTCFVGFVAYEGFGFVSDVKDHFV